MSRAPQVSIVVCTYNRSESLARALPALINQRGDSPPFEVLVIDNNSSDDTARVVRRIAESHPVVRYHFEPKQGLSHARNTGIVQAAAPILAFTDDDVRLSDDWVSVIASTFDRHPEIDYIGGKVLPQWPEAPPRWLTTAHWSPLALLDAGDDSIVLGEARRKHVVGANFAFRRSVFERIGDFATHVQRVKDGIGSTEDHEFQMRCWKAKLLGLYVPQLVVWADVQPDRLTKRYHRRWYAGHGAYNLMMGAIPTTADGITLFGTPMYHYRDAARSVATWVRSCFSGDEAQTFADELHCHEVFGAIRKGFTLHREASGRSIGAEVARCLRSIARRRSRASNV